MDGEEYTKGPWHYDGEMFIFAGDGSGPVAEVRDELEATNEPA